mmetsp:Transcript_96298/g.272233  ORF Transcript_96298/g.272233 Transcript_96298/m.272233 type:complete len:216 (-) Transcript_96298:109-756(-)
MAAGLSNEKLALAKWRLEHGETVQGWAFYHDPKFAKWCEVANLAEQQSKAGQAGTPMSPAVVQEMHETFVNATEGSIPELEAWKRFCDMLRETEKIRGAIDAPLRDTGERATHRAAELGNVKNLMWLAENGADLSAATAPAYELSPDGDASLSLSPVHVAATYGQLEVLKLLKAKGVDINQRRPDGVTALDFAEDSDQTEVAAWLLANGGVRGRT